jgi:hypothetical protein
MVSALRRAVPYVFALVVAIAAGAYGTGMLQKKVPLAPGAEGCARLEGRSEQTSCIAKLYADRLPGESLPVGAERDLRVHTVIARADRDAAKSETISGLCHPAMHEVGRAEGELAARAGKVPGFPTEGSMRLCTAGFVHGLAEGYLQSSSNPDIAAIFPKLCHEKAAASGCAHGIGHALLRQDPEREVVPAARESVTRCATLNGSFAADCYNGVFMELAMRAPDFSSEQYTKVCDSQQMPLTVASCWSYLPLVTNASEIAPAKAATMCTKAPPDGAPNCIAELGRSQALDGIELCASLPKLREDCLRGAVSLSVSSGHVTRLAAEKRCRKDAGADADLCVRLVRRAAAPDAA